MALVPEGEREEIRQIYGAKGFRGADLDRAVAVITSDRERWIDTMMVEEYGQPRVLRVPFKARSAPSPPSSCVARSPCSRS